MERYETEVRKEQAEELKWMFRLRFLTGLGFFFAGLILWMHKVFIFPILPFSIAPLGMAFINQPYAFIARRIKNLYRLMEFHLIADVFLISWGIHCLGGMDAFYLTILYALPILFAGYLVSARAAFWVASLSIFCYSEIIWLEHSQVLELIPVLGLRLDLSLRLGTLLIIILALYLIAYISSFLGEAVRKRREEIRSAREYISNIIKSMIDTLIVVDPEGKIKTINKATSDLLGYKEEELIGKSVATIYAEEETEEEAEEKAEASPFKGTRMRELIEGGSIRDYDMEYKTRSGEKIPVSFFGSVVRDKDGNSIGIVGIARDMREIKRHIQKERELRAVVTKAAEVERERAAELAKAYKELEETRDMLIQAEKMSAVGQLASGVAHEVKNPLAMIMQSVNYLEKKLSAEKEVSEVVKIIKDDTVRADKIVCALVDFARITKLDIKDDDINSVLEGSLLLIQPRLRLENVEIIKEMGKDLPMVPLDKAKMEQVFVNLFLNAIQAMPKGGRLFIRSHLRQPPASPDTNLGRENADYLKSGQPDMVVEIEDTGSGILKEHLQKVFDPFFTTKGPREGAGLGLSVIKNIIDMHKGLIEIGSEAGKGTKVTLILRSSGAR